MRLPETSTRISYAAETPARLTPMPAPLPSVEDLLTVLWEHQGTDLLLTADTQPRIRVNTELIPVPGSAPLSADDTRTLVKSLLSQAQWDSYIEGSDVDFSFGFADKARVRGNAFHQRSSMSVALRIIPSTIPTVDELGLPPVVRKLVELKQGLVLVTGPTGSGKSTTLAAMIDWINTYRQAHIITIEDPIEYVHSHKACAIDQREVGRDTDSFASALRNALREDPDVLLVGEMRDLESIRFALTLAETGHLVFGTLHTNDSAQAIDRMIDVFPGDQQPQIRVQLASCLTAVLYQRLIPRVGGGQVAAHEVLMATVPLKNLIKTGKTNQIRNQLMTGQRDGMQTLETSLNALVAQGVVSYDDAAARSLYPKEIRRPV